MTELADKRCAACSGDVPGLTSTQIEKLLGQVAGWEVLNDHHLTKTHSFPDFVSALAFVNRVGALAEDEGHHPDIYLAWGRVRIEIWTHKIDGLTESDFVLAAKIDAMG
jgi:4a-hydroxytetrahydrobiopterin dehydratase